MSKEKKYQVRFCVEYNVTAENEDEAYEEAEKRFGEDWQSLEFGINEMFSHDIEEVEKEMRRSEDNKELRGPSMRGSKEV